jgi:hypothetical protein
VPKPAKGFPAGDLTAVSTTLGWRLVTPRMPGEWTVSLGECNEQLRENYGVSPLQERGERYGVAAICIGVGQGLAVVLEITEVVLGGAAR